MAQQIVNIGTVPNDGTGDTLRVGMNKINENFAEIYAVLQSGKLLMTEDGGPLFAED